MPHKDPEARRAYEKQRAHRHNAQANARRQANPEPHRARARHYRAANPERYRQLDKQRYQRNREKRLAAAREYGAVHKEQRRQNHKAYYALHRERLLAADAERRLAKHEEIRATKRRYQRTGAEVIRLGNARRRARQKGARVNNLSRAQWQEIQAVYDHRCVYCGKRRKGHLTQDHLTPLSQGGTHTADNIVPACQSCNSRKNTGPPLCPVQPLLLTIAPARKEKKT